MSGPDFKRNEIAIAVSREMAIMYGLIEPTAEERKERAAGLARWIAEGKVRLAKQEAMLAALATKADPATVAILNLHHLSDEGSRPTCEGCDQGCGCDDAEWPCSTILTLAEAHGIETP